MSNAGNAIRPLRTQIGRVLARYSIWFVGLCLIYSVLLVVGCAVPQSAVEANRLWSIQFLTEESLNSKSYNPLYGNTRLDNFSDLLMLNGCVGSAGVISYAFSFYSRYWNGWFILVKPLLLVGDITVVRVIQSGIFLLLLGTALIMISRKLGYAFSMLFLLALLPARLDIVAVSLEYSHAFWVMLIAVIWLCCGKHSRGTMLFAFFVIGSVVNYVDILTAPVLTLVVPLAVALLLNFKAEGADGISARKFLTFPVLGAVNWGIGYAFTWGAKWLLSTLITGRNVFAIAARAAAFRSYGVADNTDVYPTFGSAMQRIGEQFVYSGDIFIYAVLAILTCIVVICLLAKRRKIHGPKAISLPTFKDMGIVSASLLLTALMPIAWVLGFAQHTWVHALFMTYRILCGTLLCMFFIVGLWVKRVVDSTAQAACGDKLLRSRRSIRFVRKVRGNDSSIVTDADVQ